MALFNEILVGRYNGILHKLLGMKEGAPAPQLSPDVTPTLVLENDRPEYGYLAGDKILAAHEGIAGDATHYPVIQFKNPADSGILAVLESVLCSLSATGLIELRFVSTAGGNETGNQHASRDRRYTGRGSCVMTNQAPLAIPANILVSQQLILAQTIYQLLPLPIVLPPDVSGNSVITISGPLNTTLRVSCMWRERALEPSELR